MTTVPYLTGRQPDWRWNDLFARLWWLYGFRTAVAIMDAEDEDTREDLAAWRHLGLKKGANDNQGGTDADDHVVKGNPAPNL